MRLSTTEWGDPAGPPLVCLHGAGGHGGRFRDLAGALPGLRVVGVDLRGHGASTWDPPWGIDAHVEDLLETADALGLGGCAWLGHSFGGRLVCEVAARAPDRVERAVLLDPALHIAPDVARERAELLREDVSFADAEAAIDARLADGTLFSTPRALLEAEAAAHLEQGADGRWRWRCFAPAVISAFGAMAAPAPPWPPCPTLLVIGARSWLPVDVPPGAAVEVVTVPGGHSVLWDDFEETAGAVARFLD